MITHFHGIYTFRIQLLSALPRTLPNRLYRTKCFWGICFFLLANGLSTTYVDAQLNDGLVGHWSFDEGVGNTAGDSSGNANTGILFNGPAWESGKSGGALRFDGGNDYVEVPHAESLNLSAALTVSVWINNEALTNSGLSQDQYRIIASKGWPPDDGSWTLAWRANDGALFFFVGRNASYRYAGFSYDNSQAGAWHFVTAVLDNGKVSLYKDGVLKAGPVGIDSGAIRTDTSPIRVGSLGVSSSSLRNWDGLLDELRVYNRALSADEIATLYEQDNSAPFGFSLANSMNLSVTQGSAATNTITASLVSGSPQPVSFSISGLPAGASGSFSQKACSPTCSSLLTIATAESTPTGTYTITVTAKAEGFNKTTSFTLTVNSSTAKFDFTLGNDGDKSVLRGQSITSTITATLSSGSTQNVSFSTTGLPSGATASYATSTSCSPTCSRTLSIETAESTPVGSYTITVTAAGGEVNKTTSFTLGVTSTASTAIISPAQGTTFRPGQTVTATGSGTNLSWNIDLIGDGLPSFKTGTGSSITFTVPTNANSSQIIRIILTGNGGSATRDYSITTGDLPPVIGFDFSLGNSGNLSVVAGLAVSSTISAALIAGSTQPVTFSAAGLPPGTTASFSSASCSPSCSSTLTVATSASTPTGSSTITVTATGGGITKTTALSLTVSSPTQTAPVQIALIWQDNSNNENNFAIERKTGTSGTYSQIATTAMNVTSYVDTSVNRGVTYCYQVRAVNSAGASAYTNEACKTAP
jgi:hypothetical protein